jgi:hypothetical protein
MIDESLQEVIVRGFPFNTTMLFSCVVPNPEPDIVTCVPTAPPSGKTLDRTGGADADVIETLSKVAVVRSDPLSLLTAKPI